ncbi:MAG: hypothetical protein WKF36_06730, partial [Candidatus Nitrosocosmicus sp.]
MMQNLTTNTIFTIAVVVTAFTAVLQYGPANLAFSQAVELIPINTGNVTLDGSLPVFYECIEEAVDTSENAPHQAPYFEDEPTKNEVRGCYQEVLIDNPVEPGTD